MSDPVQHSLDRDAIRAGVLRLAETVEPDGQYDPADDPRPGAALLALTDALGNVNDRAAAEGIHAALMELWRRWQM